jgi:hypothetical protein
VRLLVIDSIRGPLAPLLGQAAPHGACVGGMGDDDVCGHTHVGWCAMDGSVSGCELGC